MKRRATSGFTLIELMVAMLLGLIVIAGVTSVFLANQRTYRTNQALGEVQDSARTAYEMIARDIRDAGLTGCGNAGRVANVLNNGPNHGGTTWWADWNNSVRGFGTDQIDVAVATGTGTAERLSTSDSLMLIGGEGTGASVRQNAEPAGTMLLNEAGADFAAGDIVIACDPDHATMLQVNAFGANTITHQSGVGSPGNCTMDLGFPTACGGTASYVFAPNSLVTRVKAVDWYVGTNPDGGTSLYRRALVNNAGVPTLETQEMVRDITGLNLRYHEAANSTFVTASAVGNWGTVDAIQVSLTMRSSDERAGTDNQALTRTFTATTTLRNRVL